MFIMVVITVWCINKITFANYTKHNIHLRNDGSVISFAIIDKMNMLMINDTRGKAKGSSRLIKASFNGKYITAVEIICVKLHVNLLENITNVSHLWRLIILWGP